jgi:hypothetical protein
MKQYIRLYLDERGVIEHIETQDRPLRETPSIEISEPISLPPPNATRDEINAIPRRRRVFDYVTCEFEPEDGKFKRAREIMDSLVIRQSDLHPRIKANSKARGRLRRIHVKKADRPSVDPGPP